MTRKWFTCVLSTLLLAGWAQGAIVLTFEGVGDLNNVGDFYNGGAGGSLGISFSDDSLAVEDADDGGGGNIANEPSANTVLFFLTGGEAVMNVPGGFTTGFSFFYSAAEDGEVNVFDGVDGTGNLLGTLPLIAQFGAGCTGDPSGAYCNWTAIGVAFAGTARSVSFAGTDNFIAFDDITIGSPQAGTPEPSALVLAGAGLALLAVFKQRRSKPE